MRINIIDPRFLLDQHLMAEYNEFAMLISSIKRSRKSIKGISVLPEEYTLGQGHGKFFYNKRSYIISRYDNLKNELIKRKFNINPNRELDFYQLDNRVNWLPERKDIYINIKRILDRFSLKPSWYRYYKRNINTDYWFNIYKKIIKDTENKNDY